MTTLENQIEKIGQEQPFTEESEMSKIMENLDHDELDKETSMSNMDVNSRLNDIEIRACLVIDELQRQGILPEMNITRQIKRLNISKNGLGREEKVKIAIGHREEKTSGGFLSKMSNLLTRRE